MELDVGDKVKLHTKKGDFNCRILDSHSKEIILVKLDSGYNIGIREEDILDVKQIREKKTETKKPELKLSKNKPNIAFVMTGGTISSKLDNKTGAVSSLTDPKDLLNVYPELLDIANVTKIEVPFMKGSGNMDTKDWEKISESVSKLLNDDKIGGVIVTHGTDFLHYTGSALSFSLGKLNKPVVLTYSQRSSDRGSSDARLNLLCATQMAISDVAEVVLVGHATNNDDFCYALKAVKTRKMHTSRRDSFRPINSRPIAKIYPNKIEIMDTYNPRNKDKIKLSNKFSDKVALVKYYPGQDTKIVDYFIENKYKGIVFEASGLGHLAASGSSDSFIPKIKKAIKSGISICISSQTLYGRTDGYVYDYGRELIEAGAIYLEDMLPETAFVKLSWVLSDGKMKKNVKENMLDNFRGEINDKLAEEEFLN